MVIKLCSLVSVLLPGVLLPGPPPIEPHVGECEPLIARRHCKGSPGGGPGGPGRGPGGPGGLQTVRVSSPEFHLRPDLLGSNPIVAARY